MVRFLTATTSFSAPTLCISFLLWCNNQITWQKPLREIGFILTYHLRGDTVPCDWQAWWQGCDRTIYTLCKERNYWFSARFLCFASVWDPISYGDAAHIQVGPPSSLSLSGNPASDIPNSMSLRWFQIHPNWQQRLTVTEAQRLVFKAG